MTRSAFHAAPGACAALAILAAHLAGAPPRAATPLDSLRYSSDVTVPLGAAIVQDHDVAADNLSGGVTVAAIGAIPSAADLDAYHRLAGGNGELLSFDTTVELPGGLVAAPGDVVRFDGSVHTLEFDASAHGIPSEIDTDAVTKIGGDLLLSFDTDVRLDGVTFRDEDLARFDGSTFSLFFAGSSAGLPAELAVDAAHLIECNGHLLLSLDGGGSVGGVAFDDEDLLEYDPGVGTWSLAFDGSAATPAWGPADLDAVHATPDPGPGPATIFGQTVTAQANKTGFTWPNPVDFVSVRGEFVVSTDIGTYVFDAQTTGNGASIEDADSPAAGTGFWYLLRRGGCQLTSWQTALGAEPTRDSALP